MAAHGIGGAVVFVLLGFLMSVPEEVQEDYGLTLLNGVVLAGYLAVIVPVELPDRCQLSESVSAA